MGMLRRLTGNVGEPDHRPSRHHHRRHSHGPHKKNYSVPVLGGSVPVEDLRPAAPPPSPEREKKKDKERHLRSRASSTSSSRTHASSHHRRSGGNLKNQSDVVVEESVLEEVDDERERVHRSSKPRSKSVDAARARLERTHTTTCDERHSHHGHHRAGAYSLCNSKSCPMCKDTEQTRPGTSSSATERPTLPGSSTSPDSVPKPTPLERARRRNTYTAYPGNPPYPMTPPVTRALDGASRDYVAYQPPRASMEGHIRTAHTWSVDRPPVSPKTMTEHPHPSLRPGLQPRTSSTIAQYSEPAPTSPLPANVVEIGSSDSAPSRPQRADSGKSFSSTSGANKGSGPQREDPYDFLREFNTVFVVDDSASMDGGDLARWHETRAALETVAAVATKYDSDGIDIKFMNHRAHDTYHLTSAAAIRGLFARVQPAGCTPTGRCLDEILRDYTDRYAAFKWGQDPDLPRPPPVKPLNIVVLTDGEPTDDPESVIVDAARALERLNAPLHQVGIQFVQIGDEPGAREALEELDDALADVYGIRDMVDTTPYNGIRLTGETVLKVLLGGVNRRIDRKTNEKKPE